MVSRELRRRADRVRAQVPAGGSACRGWHAVWLIGEDDLEPPEACDRCGRWWAGEVRVYVGVRLADV